MVPLLIGSRPNQALKMETNMPSLSKYQPLVIFLVALTLLAAAFSVQAAEKKDLTQTRPHGKKVTVALEYIDVSDGDTVNINWPDEEKERIRILGIDTPEVAHPHYGQYQGQPFGSEAAAFAAGAFAAASKVELLRAAETDHYGRTLGYLFINGRNYSVMVIQARYSAETVTHYGDNGFPEVAEEVLAASREVGPVPFEAPYKFRRRMRELEDWQEKESDQ